ncbi:MAG: transaldolase [Actinomycetota bacterium]|nr:transaldolase [Actinomycetota bacterium]
MNERLRRLAEIGQSVWMDSLSRDDIKSGNLESMIESGVVGVTSNPTIFQKAISKSSLYDEQLEELSQREDDPKEIFLELAREDIQDACDLLVPVFERTDRLDGFVSLEVSPDLAYDTPATVEEAIRLHKLVDRPNLMVKIPATLPGLAAIEDMIAIGKSINVTLTFSLMRYRAVAGAYIRGLQRLVAAGGDPSGVASVASFFVSRVDTETDRRLDELGRDDIKGRLAIANAKLAYAAFKEIFAGDDWEFLESKGATKQRPLWASTSTKNPAYGDVMYVEELVGPDTVNTMPTSTLEAFMDHGEVRSESPIEEGLDEARALIGELRKAGVDYEDVTEVLEKEGVQKFADSFDGVLEEIKSKGRTLASR